MTSTSPLLRAMLADLERSGIKRADAERMRVQPLVADSMFALSKEAIIEPGYRLPYFNLDGSIDPLYFRLRRLQLEQQSDAAADTKPLKGFRYWQPEDSIPRLYTPPLLKSLTWQQVADDPKLEIWITEGEKKSAKACVMGLTCAGVGGVWNWKSKKAQVNLIPDLKNISWENRDVVIVYDAEVAGRASLQGALHALARELTKEGARVSQVELPPESDRKIGLDDYLVENDVDDLKKLERVPFNLNRELWTLNDSYSVLKQPTAILRFEDNTLMSEKDFRLQERSRSILSVDAAGRPKEVEAATQWLKWRMHSRTTKLIYQPRSLGASRDVGDGSYNLWRGWGAAAPRKSAADAKLFRDLLDHLCADAESAMRTWVEQWLAYPIQNPGVKLNSALLIHGAQSAGKTMLGYAMREVYGSANFSEIKQADLKSQFNDWLPHRQFILADEITSTHKRAEMNYIKGLITQAQVTVNRKFQPAYTLKDIANYLFVSNDIVPVSLEADDRRFGVIHVMAQIDAALSKAFGAMYLSERGRNAIAWHLANEVDCANFEPYAAAPMSDAKQELTENSRSQVANFVSECIVSYDAMFSFAGDPTPCDFQTADSIAARYNAKHANERNQSTSAVEIGRLLGKHAEARKIFRVRQFKSERDNGRWIRAYAFRNVAKWRKASLAAAMEHWDSSLKTLQEVASNVANIDDERAKRRLHRR